MASERILELLRRPVDVDEYTEIRELWKTHSLAEDSRDLPGLISTLTEDCVYEVMGTGARWEGHDGAARFYTELLTAFPDIHFDLEYIVIGPQGVCEEARVTATHEGRWLQHEPSGERLEWRNAIFFPWDPAAKLFKGELVYTDRLDADRETRADRHARPSRRRSPPVRLRRGNPAAAAPQRRRPRGARGDLPDALSRRPLPRPSGDAQDLRAARP
jgi:hypothetical protein